MESSHKHTCTGILANDMRITILPSLGDGRRLIKIRSTSNETCSLYDRADSRITSDKYKSRHRGELWYKHPPATDVHTGRKLHDFRTDERMSVHCAPVAVQVMRNTTSRMGPRPDFRINTLACAYRQQHAEQLKFRLHVTTLPTI